MSKYKGKTNIGPLFWVHLKKETACEIPALGHFHTVRLWSVFRISICKLKPVVGLKHIRGANLSNIGLQIQNIDPHLKVAYRGCPIMTTLPICPISVYGHLMITYPKLPYGASVVCCLLINTD